MSGCIKKILLFICMLVAFQLSEAQTELKQKNMASQALQQRGEVYFSFQRSELIKSPSLFQKISVSQIEGERVFAYANQKQFADFSTLKINYTVLQAPSELFDFAMTDSPAQVLSWNYYPTYTAYESLMQQFASDHPSICKLITLATLNSGRKLLALRISQNANVEANKPEFLYTSSIHGDETTGYILMLHLADSLLSAYGQSPRITNLVNNFDIVICPLANPDGTYKGGNASVSGATRFNANNIDLNRNYPDPNAGPHPDGNAWQPETVAFMNFAAANTFTMGANFHGGSEVVNYPWDTWPRTTADNDWWIYTSRAFVDTAHVYAPAGYLTDQNNGITDGFAWYQVTGGRQDYMNFYHHCRESTIEISTIKMLPASQLISYWNYTCRSLLSYIEESGYGLRGLVTDSLTGSPLYAKIFINNFDKDSSQVYTDPQVGDYHRLLKAGNYTVTFSASGYKPKTMAVQVSDHQSTIMDVKLATGSMGVPEEPAADELAVTVSPNPVADKNVWISGKQIIEKMIASDITGNILITESPHSRKFQIACPWPAGIYVFRFCMDGKWISRKIVIN